MVTQTIKTGLNFSQIEDQVALLLHAHGAVPSNANIVDIDFGETDENNVVPLTVKYEKEQEVSASNNG